MAQYIRNTLQVLGGITFVGATGAAIGSSYYMNRDELSLPTEMTLYIPLSGSLPEAPVYKSGIIQMFGNQPLSLREIEQALRYAKTDERVKCIVGEIYPDFSAGPGQLEEIRESVRSCDNTLTIAMSKSYDNVLKYYLASGFDRIMISPFGTVGTEGLSIPQFFMKKFLDRLGIEYEDLHVGQFKSAPEMYSREKPSDENSSHHKMLISNLENNMLKQILNVRPLSENLALGKLYLSYEAINQKIVDVIGYTLSDCYPENMKKPEIVTLNTYLELRNKEEQLDQCDKIAVIYMNGEIQQDNSYYKTNSFGVEDNVNHRLLLKADEDEDVKSVIIRMNTPGGDVISSDLIGKTVENMKKQVVVSMSDTCASGGYWIACGADHIVAHALSVTGSIGVFSGKFVVKGLLDKLGIHVLDGGGFGSPFSSWTENQKHSHQKSLDYIYEEFQKRVMLNRDIDPESIDMVAEGRVWTGTMAQELNLIDSIGGYEKSIQIAKKLANIDENTPVQIIDYQNQKSMKEKLYEIFRM